MSAHLNSIFPIMMIAIFSACQLPAYAQSKNIKDQTFNVILEIDQKGALVLTSLHDPNGHPLKAEMGEATSLLNLGFQTAIMVEGTLRVTSFASAGGLGSTRSGDGKGILEIDLLRDKNGNKVKCAADCASGHNMTFKLL